MIIAKYIQFTTNHPSLNKINIKFQMEKCITFKVLVDVSPLKFHFCAVCVGCGKGGILARESGIKCPIPPPTPSSSWYFASYFVWKGMITISDQPTQTNNLRPTISDQPTQINNLRSTISEQQSQINNLRSTISDQSSQAHHLRPTISDQQSQISQRSLTNADQLS